MDSTPADCVRYAVLGLREHFDLILSGINRGFNLGKDIVYSGTVGAIFEGGRLGIPAIALSTDPRDFTSALGALPELLAFFQKHNLLSHTSLYNVNIPIDHKGIRITRQGDLYFTDEFEHIGNDIYVQKGYPVPQIGEDLNLDTDAVRGGYLSVTPLSYDRTNLEVFERLQEK
jgi:5'-nucleotidase